MQSLSLPNIKLGLADLFDKRLPDLLKTDTGKYHQPKLKDLHDKIDDLPKALTGGLPLAEELSLADGDHDGYGGALYFACEVYERLPNAAPDLLEAVRRIRAALIPSLGDLTVPYATEAANAIERKGKLPELKEDLKRIPLADGTTLHDVAKKFLDAGARLDELLSQRADVPKTSRKDAAILRSKTVGVLFRLRGDLRDEIADNPKLPRDLEHKVFGYFDTLHAMQAQAAQAAAATAKTGKAAADKAAADKATAKAADAKAAEPVEGDAPPRK